MKKFKNIVLQTSLIVASIGAAYSAFKVLSSYNRFKTTVKKIDIGGVRCGMNELTDAIIFRQKS